MIVWINRSLALAIHERQMAEHGGGTGIRDEGLLESALARPHRLHAYGDPPPDFADLAASLAYGLARNHPFVDGNKRTAHVCYYAFLAINDVHLEAGLDEMYIQMLTLAEGSLSEADFAAWMRPRLRSKSPNKVHEPRRR
ncbi:MAG TPA: type II toxin-antitoxin system death-on-curing family toxin [Thermomonas sp.]|jgi:death-on-curing protein|nr:type II toxin-antitoxin system death-on-curing family toxin [Thermomonas sp.]HOZ24834.1 type II toxin-antitoxin system death-on-curing family toxin [Thermomonas sp.]HPM55929.1 type II toxin-antitoxin system death-on-curing family toxin [Thermomonas sp.]HPW12962.1 type II toxin-antitoxin system death-on-curing family toxin [Thermomonas sp.]